MPLDALSAALLALVQSGEGIPINVHVTPSEQVQELLSRIAELEEELRSTKEILHRSEFKRGCEMRVRENIIDYCKDHGLKLPRELFSELW